MATKLPAFSYTGQYRTEMKNGYWHIYFLTSGVLTMSYAKTADAFLCGGGAGGRSNSGPGGGGGYTATHRGVQIAAGTAYTITVGNGGAINQNGQASGAFGFQAAGGKIGGISHPRQGGNGGSGGGASNIADYGKGGTGGENGGNGAGNNTNEFPAGGIGQGRTTRGFEEASYPLYAGGGGGYSSGNGTYQAPGGNGGGGKGGYSYVNDKHAWGAGSNGQPNTGGGGGGGPSNDTANIYAGAGGSGIVILRGTEDDLLPVFFNGVQLSEMHLNGKKLTGLVYGGQRIFARLAGRRLAAHGV